MYIIGGVILSLVIAASLVLAPSPVIPIVLLVSISLIVLLCRYPQSILYLVFAAACLFELEPTNYADAITDHVPFFWNINTIVQRYAHADFKAIPLNLLEVLLLLAGACALLRAVGTKRLELRTGKLFWPIFLYICFVGIGWINGMLTGGDFKVSLMEVRPQFYFFLAYLMAVNIVRDRRQVDALLWTMALCIGIKGILYTFRRYVTLAGLPLPDGGVGSHEEAFLFDAYILLLVVLSLFRTQPRLRWLMWSFLPFVFLGNLATNRRAGTAALAIALPILFMAADRALPEYRKRIRVIGLILAACLLVYYFTFKNSDSILAQPARAISSTISPNARDESSNAYRDAENADLMATIKIAPIQGFGYGKPMLHAVPIADISSKYEYWDIMTHNSVLWVWMRVGTFGFIAFWMMVSGLVIRACRTLRDAKAEALVRAVASYILLVISILIIFGLLDLQLTIYRDMLFAGFWVGILARLSEVAASRSPELETTR